MSKDEGKYLYHYTTERGAESIRNTEWLKPSTDTFRDAALGRGVYMTSKPPHTSTRDLMDNNYDGASNDRGRVEHYVRVPKAELPNARCYNDGERNIYVVPGRNGIDLASKNCKFGQRVPKQ